MRLRRLFRILRLTSIIREAGLLSAAVDTAAFEAYEAYTRVRVARLLLHSRTRDNFPDVVPRRQFAVRAVVLHENQADLRVGLRTRRVLDSVEIQIAGSPQTEACIASAGPH